MWFRNDITTDQFFFFFFKCHKFSIGYGLFVNNNDVNNFLSGLIFAGVVVVCNIMPVARPFSLQDPYLGSEA